MKLPLKTPANRRKHVGLHIDHFIQLATQNGYACTFVHDNSKGRTPGRRELLVHVKDNLVTKIL